MARFTIIFAVITVLFWPFGFISAKEFFVNRPTADQITQAIANASLETGVRAVLLYGVLGQETSFGGNLGKTESEWTLFCAGRGIPDCVNWQKYDCKSGYANARYYDEILTRLGYVDQSGRADRSNIPTSSTCALGFAQFEPNTWWLSVASRALAQNPWDINDAMLASAYYLKDLGADSSEELAQGEIIGLADRIALQKYYCGGYYNRSECRAYARGVESRARSAEVALQNLDLRNELARLQQRRETVREELRVVSEGYAGKSDEFPIILELADSHGGILRQSMFNGYFGTKDLGAWPQNILRPGDKLKISVKAEDPDKRKILYHWSSNSDDFNKRYRFDRLQNEIWRAENELEYEIGEGDLLAGPNFTVTIRIRALDGRARDAFTKSDDSISANYALLPSGVARSADYYAKIISFSDNRGNFIKKNGSVEFSEANNIVHPGDKIKLKVRIADSGKEKQVFFRWDSSSTEFRRRFGLDRFEKPLWRTDDDIEYEITENDLRESGQFFQIGVHARRANRYARDIRTDSDDEAWLSYRLFPEGIKTAAEYFPSIVKFEDSKGNTIKPESGGYALPESSQTKVKIGEKLRLRIIAQDPQGRQVFYHWSSNSAAFNRRFDLDLQGRPLWRSDNSIEYEITGGDLASGAGVLSITVSIRSDKKYFRQPYSQSDESFSITYTIVE